MSGNGSSVQMAEEQRFVIEISVMAYKPNQVPLNEAEFEKLCDQLPELYAELADCLWKNLHLQLLSVMQKANIICIANNIKDYSEFINLKEIGMADRIITSFVKAKLDDILKNCDLILDYSSGLASNAKSDGNSTSKSSEHYAMDPTGRADGCCSEVVEHNATRTDSAAAPITQDCSRQSSGLSHDTLSSTSNEVHFSRKEENSRRDVFEAQFWLFLPESVGKVKEVWLVLNDSSDKIMMTRKDKMEMVWTTRKKITRSTEYRYILHLKDSGPVAFAMKVYKLVTLQKKNNKLEDAEWRQVSEHIIQKDILSAEYESKDKIAAYSYFLTQMFEAVQSTDQLKQQIEDFNRKHYKLLEHRSGLVELAFNLVHHFIRDRYTTPLKAVFVVHVVAALNKHSGFLNDLVKQIDPKNLKVLIKCIKNSTFELLAKENEVKSDNITIALVEHYVGSNCTFIDLVLYSYPAVSGQNILEIRDKYGAARCSSEKTVMSAVKHLCHYLEKQEVVCELLHETVCRGESFRASLHVLSVLHNMEPIEQEHCTFKQLRRQVTHYAKKWICSSKSFDQLYKLYAVMDDSDQDLMSEFSCEFEGMVLDVIDEHSMTQEQIPQLKDIILNHDFFKVQKHAVALLTMVVGTPKIHFLFPELLTIAKFAKILSADSPNSLLGLVKIWLDTARQMKDRFGYDHQWYDHILSITRAEIIGQNKEVLSASEAMILSYFCAAAKKSIACCADMAKLALDSSLLEEDRNTEKAVFAALSCELEQHLIDLARTREHFIEKQEQDAFSRLVTSHLMFTEKKTSIVILEAVAGSEDSCVHGMFVHIMSTRKFFKQFDQVESGNIFKIWFDAEENFHWKKNQKLHDFSDSILQLYQFLADVFSNFPPDYDLLKKELESCMKKRLADLSISTRLALLQPSIAAKVRPNTFAILEKHVTEMKDVSLPKREMEMHLKSYSETSKNDHLQSYAVQNMLLVSVFNMLEGCQAETEKVEFILSYSPFWLCIICDKYWNNDRTVILAKSLLNSFSEKVHKSTITLKEFCDLKTFFTESTQSKEKLLQLVSVQRGFSEHWQKLAEVHKQSLVKYEQLKSLCENFLCKMSDNLSIKDIDVIEKELNEARDKLATSSSSKMGELNKPGFFKHLDDLIEYAECLYPLQGLNGFLVFCRHCVSELGISESDAGESMEDEMNCSSLFVAGEEASYESCSLTAVDVAKYITEECIEQYVDWLRQAATDTSTLGCMLKYGDYKEMEYACDHFKIHISHKVLSAFKWLNDLEGNKQKVISMCGTMEVVGLKVKGTDVGTTIETFLKCVTNKQDVTISEFSLVMQKLQNFLGETDEELWAVFEELSRATQLVHFLQESIEDDFRNLIDAVEERSEQTLDETTVSDLIKVKEFLQPILRKKTWGTPEELFKTIQRYIEKAGTDISKKINNCFYHWHGLKALYQFVANRGELTKDIIANAMTRGTYLWNLDQSSLCTVSLTYKKLKSNDKLCLGSEELNDLRSRALLLSNSEKKTQDRKGNQDRADLQNFVEVVDVINEVSCTVTELHQLGHFSYKTFSRKMQSSKISELPQILNSLKKDLDGWKSALNTSRQKHLSLNFLHSDQLSLINNFLFGKCDSENQVQNVLNFVCPGASIAQLKQFQQNCNKNISTTEENLASIGLALDAVKKETIFHRRNFFHDKKFKSLSQDVNAVVQPGTLYIAHFETDSAQTIPILLSLYANTKGYFPVPSEVLFCHKETSWEEIQLIIQRSLLSAEADEVSELHCICNVESLPGNLQSQLVDALGDLLQNCTSNYSLAVICQGGAHHPIIDHFSSFLHHLQGFDTALLQFYLQTIWPEVTMITSNVPGLGKTEYIQNLASERGCRIKTVHISGPMSRDSLVTRLQKLDIQQCDLLHVNIGEVEDPKFVDACLFQYIVLGCLHSGTKLVCLPTSTVAIEIANTVQDRLKDSLAILSSFKLENIQWKNFENFLVSSEICSPVQIVCNYLKSFDDGTLDSRDLIFNGDQRVEALPPATCRQLLTKHFSAAADLSFAVIETYLNVLGNQLVKLSNSPFFYVTNLKAMLGEEHPNDVKSKLVKAFFETAKGFASRSVQSCRSMQHFAQAEAFAPIDSKNKRTQEAPQKLDFEDLVKERMKNMVRWADTNHLLVTFNRTDCQTVSALYRDLHEVPKYIKKLFKSQLQKDLPNFAQLSEEQLKVILIRVMGSTLQHLEIIETDVSYAVTPDNLLKMVLVFLRVRANVPVVIMGETGCGKTSLIRYLAHACRTTFKHFSIHAGTTVEEISEEVFDCVNKCLDNSSSELWMFLDEVNTCEHLGLLSEIICHHSYLGKTLPRNLVVLAACNPYRLRKPGKIMTAAGLEGKVKMDEFSRFVYRVHPLPEAMIDYVWDYGTLHRSDEESYIRQMVRNIFQESNKSWNLKEKIAKLLIASQDFTRTAEGNDWCVSLRDVYRCQMLMTQFLKMLQSKLDHAIKNSRRPNYNKSDLKIHNCAIALALAHCYQSRLADNKTRDKYWQLCSTIMFDSEEKYKDLVDMVRFEQLDLLCRMKLPQGIAMNTALCENVFVILTCILHRIPIFLVGKPGCSKSLSVQLIKSNLRGKDSVDSYFQTLPNLYIVSYQGSESSTSEGIEKVFRKAEKYRENSKPEGILPVVLLDEIGLAEVSKFNPLKILHGLLEPATGQLPNVAVVGISNWCLDAAKMNRAIHLSRPDMNVEELFATGKAISQAKSSARCSDKMLKALAEAYDKYQRKQRIQNFHGLRDYYALIKYVSRHLNRTKSPLDDKIDEVTVIQKGFQRNFGGLESGPSEISEMFLSSVNKKSDLIWNVEDIITENLEDVLARHLMLVTSGDSALGILVKCLEKLKRNYAVMFGSKFEEDQTEQYSYRILNRIILCMETGNILILKDLDTIYGSLYDMLNQNYSVVGKKKNCRIALGPHSNPMCHVHDNFRCIVLVDEDKVNLSDPPFLNRFEKQVLRFDDIIDEKQNRLINELEEWVHDFSHILDKPVFEKQDAFLGMNVDTISSAVYQITRELGNWNSSDKFSECRDAILWLVPPDAMLRICDSELSRKSFAELQNIQSSYFKQPIHKGLSHFLTLLEEKSSGDNFPPAFSKAPGIRLVIFTHSNIYVDIRNALEKLNPLQVEKLGNFKSEKQFTTHMRQFFESENRLLILQCEPSEDGHHLPLAKFQLEELHREFAAKTCKNICIILHISRSASGANTSSQWQFSFLSGWQLVVIDSLEMQENFPLTKALSMTVADLLQTDFRPIKDCIRENLVWAFTCTRSSYRERSIEEFSQLIVQIINSDSLVSCLAECLQKYIQKDHEESIDCVDISNPARWQVKVAFDNRRLRSATSFTDALKQYLTECVTIPLANLVHQLEKLSAWHSYFSKETEEIWVRMFNSADIFSLRNVQVPQGPGSFNICHKPLRLQYPFSQIFIEKCLKHEVFFKEELSVEMTSSNNYVLSTAMFGRYKELFKEDLTTVIDSGNVGSHESKLINDICSYLSMAYSLDEEDRVEIGLWLISFKAPSSDHMQEMSQFTTSLLCLWQHESLFHSLLQLISECQTLLPCGIKELLTAISSRNQKIESLEERTYQERQTECDDFFEQNDDGLVQLFSSVEDDATTSEDKVTKVDDQSNPIQEAGEACNISLHEANMGEEVIPSYSGGHSITSMAETKQNEMEHVSITHTYRSELETGTGHSDHTTEVEATTDIPDSSQKLLALIGLDDQEFLTLHPQERLVHLMCRFLIPTKSVLKECDGVSGWHGRVCSVLSFCSSVSSYPVSLHALRIFNDLATILFHSKLENRIVERFLMELADGIELENLEKSLDSMQMFAKAMKLMDDLHVKNVPVEEIQNFVTLCIGRIMYINPDTALLGAFLEKAATLDLIDKNLSHLQPLLHRVLLENADDPNELFTCFEAHIKEEGNESVEQYPQIVAIGDALEQTDIQNPVFLVLCIDIIQNVVMEAHAWEQLEHVLSISDCHLITFEASIKVIEHPQNVSLRLAVAVAYVKEFLHQLKEIIVFDMQENSFANHEFLYQNINSLFSCSNPVIVEYLLKELKMDRSFAQVGEVLTKLETVIPLLAQIYVPGDDLSLSVGYKLLGQSTERNIDLEKALLNVDKDDKPVCEFLNKKPAQLREILSFFEALLHTAYLPASLRQLTHSEKRIGTWIREKSFQISSDKFVCLLQQRLTNEESFSIDLFKLLPGLTHFQLQKTAFLLHLVAVLVAGAQEQHSGCSLFVACLIHPDIMLNEKVLSKISCFESNSNTSATGSLSLVTCKCWTRFIFVKSKCSSCPVCEISWKTPADILTVTETADKETTGKNILKLMISASLLGSLALDILKPECTEGSGTSDYKDMLVNLFEVAWNALETALQLNAEDLSLFLQNVVDKMNVFPKNYQSFEKDIGSLIAIVVDNFLAPSFYSDIKHYHSCVSTVKEETKHTLLELPSQHSDKSLDSLRHLFRICKRRTPEDLRAQFYINRKEETHPVLDVFFKKCHSLILLGHLLPLVKWSQLCYQATNHRFTRDECKNLTLSQLSPPEGQKENFKKHYDAFMASWKELWKKENLSILKRFDSTLPDQPLTGAVVICESSESVLYKVLKVLVNIQNMFLEELLAIAQSGKCPSLGFLKKNFTDMASIKCVLIQNLNENQVIPWNFHHLLETQTKFGQNSSEFGKGNQVCYNFVKIEMEMANSLCLGKT